MSDLLGIKDYFTAPEDVDAMAVTSCTVARVSADLPARTHSKSTDLADHTTFRLGGPARKIVRATTDAELVDAVR